MVEAVGEADGVDEAVEPRLVGIAPGELQRQEDVLAARRGPGAG